MKIKILSFLAISLLSASCSLTGNKGLVAGAIKTVNGGADWQFANTIQNNKANLNDLNVSKMSFDPSNRQGVYISGYNSGLFKWDDQNNNWKEILSNILVYDFVISPVDNRTIYAAGIFDGHGRLLITKDGGASWTQIYNDATQNNAVRSVALNPANTNQVIIGLANGSIIKSADGGLSWQLAKDFGDRVNRLIWQGGSLYALLQAKGLFVSNDAAANFTQLSAGIASPSNNIYAPITGSTLNFNQFFVDTVSPNLIYITTSEGLYKTVDAGKSWTHLNLPVENGQNVTRAIAIANRSSNLVFTSIGSTIYKSTDGGANWQTQKVATNGIVNYIIIDPELPQIAWAGIYAQQ